MAESYLDIIETLDKMEGKRKPVTIAHPMNKSADITSVLDVMEGKRKGEDRYGDVVSVLDRMEGIKTEPSKISKGMAAASKLSSMVKSLGVFSIPRDLATLDLAVKSGMAAGAATLYAIPENLLGVFEEGARHTGLRETLGLQEPGAPPGTYRPDIRWLEKMRERAEADALYYGREGFVPEAVAGLAAAPAGIIEFMPGKIGIFYAMIRGYMSEGLKGMAKEGAMRGLWGYGLKAGAPTLAPGVSPIAKQLAGDPFMIRGASKKMLAAAMAMATGVESVISGAGTTQTASQMAVMTILGYMSGGKGATKRTKATDIRIKMAEDAMKEGDINKATGQLDAVAKSQPEVIKEASIALAEKFKNVKSDIEMLMDEARTPEQRQAAIEKVMPKELEETLKLKAQARQAEIDKVMTEVTPEEAPKVLKVETSMGLIDKLVSDIKSKGKVQVPVAERKPGDVKLVEQDRKAVLAEIEKLEGLRDVAEKATGMNLKSLYDKYIDDAIATLPDTTRIELQSAISNFRKEVYFTDIESYKARKAKEVKEAEAKAKAEEVKKPVEAKKPVDKKAEELKALAENLYKGDEGALDKLKQSVEKHGAEDVAQAVRSTYMEGDTPGYKRLRPEIDRILELKPDRRKDKEFRKKIAEEIKVMEKAKAEGKTLEGRVEALPDSAKTSMRMAQNAIDKAKERGLEAATEKSLLETYRRIHGKDVVEAVLKVEPIPKAKPVVEPKKVEPKPKPIITEPTTKTEVLMAELDGLETKHLISRAKKAGLERTVWSKAYSNPEFVKRRIVAEELKAAEPTPKVEPTVKVTPELKVEARTIFAEIIKKPKLDKEDVKWLKENKDALDLSKEETQAIKTKMAFALVEPGFFVSSAQYQKSLDNIKRYFKGEKPYGEKLFTGPGLDPELVRDTARVMRRHIEQGTKDFYQVSQKIIKDVGKKVQPYLKLAWTLAQKQIKDLDMNKKDLAIANDTLKKMGIESETPVEPVSETEAAGLSPTAVNEPGLIGRFLNALESTNQTLESYKGGAQEHINAIPRIMVNESYIPKQIWLVDKFGQLDVVMKGVRRTVKANRLSRVGREANKLGQELSKVLELEDISKAKGIYSPRSIEIAGDVRKILDEIYNELDAAGIKDKKGKPIVWRKGYLPHMVKESNIVQDVQNYIGEALEGKHDDVIGSVSGSVDLFGTAKPLPTFGHAEKRTGAMKDYERNPLIALRRYVLGASRILYDKPGIEKAYAEMKKIPEGPMLDLSKRYVKNYMRVTDSISGTLRLWDAKIGRVGARSVLAFSTGLQTLHLGRVMTQVWPELGTRYSLMGLSELIKNPLRAMRETRDAGLLLQRTIPHRLKFRGEVFDNLSNYGDAGNTIAKIIAYQGFLRKVYAKHPDWTFKQVQTEAVKQTMQAEGVISQATKSILMEKIPKFFLQFKYWFQKYGENVSRAVAGAAKDPSMENMTRVGRYIMAAAIAEEITRQTGLKIFHITPYLLQLSAPVLGYFKDMAFIFAAGDDSIVERLERAFKRSAEFFTPGGISVPREIKERGTAVHKKD